jgi:AAA family ATP:ADP antiporter
LWLKVLDDLIIVFAAGAYSLIVDRTNRRKLAIGLFAIFGLCYALIFLMFVLKVPEGVTYTTLKLINGQQDNLLPMVIGALAADIFTIAESKRLFGMLGSAAIIGELVGNGSAILVARLWNGNNSGLLLTNAGWLLVSAVALAIAVRHIDVATRQASDEDSLIEVLRGGLHFVREVRLFRFLTISILWAGIGWSVVQYQFLYTLSEAFPETEDLQTSYGLFKFAIPVLLLLVQTVGLRWMLRWWGFKSTFVMMPGVLFLGLSLMLLWPSLISVAIGAYVARVTSQGIQEPSEQSFLGLVPDELRGRMGAFLHGVLYPFGEMLGYVFVGVVLWLTRGPQTAWLIYAGFAWICLAFALWMALRIRATYDKEMLNWRWQRRRRQGLADLRL